MSVEVRVERVKRRIWLTTPGGFPGSNFVSQCKQIPGHNWLAKSQAWSYPLSYDTCTDLRAVFGKQLVIGPQLREWATVERDRINGLKAIVAMPFVDLPMVKDDAPVLYDALCNRPYQTVGAAYLATANEGIIGDQPGLGKTLQIMAAVVEAGVVGPIFVTAPKAAASMVWAPEIARWLGDETVMIAGLPKAKREDTIADLPWKGEAARRAEKRIWVITNPEQCRATIGSEQDEKDRTFNPINPGLFDVAWSAQVVDESHRILIARTTDLTKQSQQRVGIGKLPLADGGMRIAASGTPFRGRRENLWGTLNWVRPDIYTSFWNWVEKWFECYNDGFGMQIGPLRDNREQSFYAEVDQYMIRRTKGEVAKDLPPKQYGGELLRPGDEHSPVGVWLEMTGKQKKAYHDMERNAAVKLEGGTLMANGVLAELTRLKQFASCHGDLDFEMRFRPNLPSNKFDWLVEFLAERGITPEDEGGDSKVVVASQFTTILNIFGDELEKMGIAVHRITGGVKDSERKAAKDAFQGEGGPRVMLINTNAGGVAITLDAADDLVFLDETYIPDDQEQVEDRIHRVSRMHQVIIWYLRTKGTIEENIALVGAERESLQKELLDGRRGVDYARQLLTV